MKKLVVFLLAMLWCAAALAEQEWIAVAPGAVLTDAGRAEAVYPRTLRRGAQSYDAQALIVRLLGEDYETAERSEWSHADEYAERGGDRKPWQRKNVIIYDDSDAFNFYDPWVAGERGGEYEAPKMNMTAQESAVLARTLLAKYLDAGFTAHVSTQRQIRERWSYAGRWMTESEFTAYMKGSKLHYSLFEHQSADGIGILDDQLLAIVGINGLSGFVLDWHEFEASEETAKVMPLDQALAMANSTRSAKTTLLAAQLVYSNRVTATLGRPEEFNLGWFLITSAGNYFVDAVENAHVCDSYEY